MSLHALELLQLLTLHPAPRAAVLAPSPAPHRSGMAVLLHAAGTGHGGPPFYGLADPEVIATALHVIVNCVTAPPSLAYLLPAPDGTGSGPPARQRSSVAAAAPHAAAGGGGGSGLPPDTPGGGGGGRGGGGGGGVSGAAPKPGHADGGGGAGADAPAPPSHVPALSPCRPDASEPAPPSLELGPSAVGGGAPPTLGDALEAGYAAARQAVRAANGIRVLLSLLQSRQHFAAAAADRTRALTVAALLGLARDAPIRHILNRLQVGGLRRVSRPVNGARVGPLLSVLFRLGRRNTLPAVIHCAPRPTPSGRQAAGGARPRARHGRPRRRRAPRARRAGGRRRPGRRPGRLRCGARPGPARAPGARTPIGPLIA
jgi:hypothetical protein